MYKSYWFDTGDTPIINVWIDWVKVSSAFLVANSSRSTLVKVQRPPKNAGVTLGVKCVSEYGCFSKNSFFLPPKSSILIGFPHYKPSILGYPYFWKHLYILHTYDLLLLNRWEHPFSSCCAGLNASVLLGRKPNGARAFRDGPWACTNHHFHGWGGRLRKFARSWQVTVLSFSAKIE